VDLPVRTTPRSVLLALWLGHAPRTRSGLREAVRAIQRDDEPHVVVGLAPVAVDLEHLITGLTGLSEVAAMLPVPGDLGVPPEVAGLAADAGECVVALCSDGGWAAVPHVVTFGSAAEPGHQVTWRVRALPSGHRSLAGTIGSIADAQADLRATLHEAVHALDDLGADSGLGDLPRDLDRRTVGLLVEAVRLRRIVDLATLDEGGAVNVWQADQRATALREVSRAARRAVAAATLAASSSAQPSTDR
jgi:hypothetical protein